MGYRYNVNAMQAAMAKRIAGILSAKEWGTLQQRLAHFEEEKETSFFNLTFTAIPRLIKKNKIPLDAKADRELQNIRNGFSIQDWTTDRIARSWWLLQWRTEDKGPYIDQMESLFNAAEMNEQVALCGSLPLFAWPEAFRQRTTTILRTNIRQVFEAIALDNPYPADYLEEAAWNQMVLKSFFMNIAVNQIIGIDERSNKTLAYILSDYAHERWSAGRIVNPLLWRPVSGFLDERILPDIKRLFQSENKIERVAATLACTQSGFKPAKVLLKKHKELEIQIKKEALNWESLT